MIDVSCQLVVEFLIIRTIYRHGCPNFPFGDGTEVDSRNRAIRKHTSEVRLPLLNGGRGIPIEADAHPFGDRTGTHTCLSIYIPRVECQAHDLELRLAVGRGFECIKLVNLIHLGIQKFPVSIRQALYQSCVSCIRINFLNYQSFRSLALVLVGTHRLHLLLPCFLAKHILLISSTNVRQDSVNRLGNAILTRTRTRHQHVHECRLVMHIVDVSEGGAPQVRPQSGEYRMCHRRFVNIWCPAYEQLNEWRKLLRHFGRKSNTRVILSIALQLITLPVILSVAKDLFTYTQRPPHDIRETPRLVPCARTPYRIHPLLPCFPIGGQEGRYPIRVIVTDIAEMARHREDKIVP